MENQPQKPEFRNKTVNFHPTIYMDYVSTVVKKTSVVLQTGRNIIIHRRK